MSSRPPVVLEYEHWQQIRRELDLHRHDLDNLRQHLAAMGTRRHQTVYMPRERVRFRNDNASTVPAWAVMRVTGMTTIRGQAVYTIDQPNTSFSRLYLVNGRSQIGSGYYGWGTWLWTAGKVLYESGTPAFGESWGPANGQWSLKKWRYGFTIQGTNDTTALTTHAMQDWVTEFYGQTDAAINKGSSGTISVYDGNNADTSVNVSSVENKFANVAISKKVQVTWRAGAWHLTSAEC